MDYFENIIKKILEGEDKWVRQNVKVNLSPAEKKMAGKPSMPRPDIDIVSYKPSTNTIELWEVKSYLDSPGVNLKDIQEGRYKILTSKKYQKIIINRLTEDWIKQGLVKKNPTVKMALATGRMVKKYETKIKEHCKKMNWRLLSPTDIKEGLKKLADLSYENDPYTIASKIIFRNK